jgi:hypothetical protein
LGWGLDSRLGVGLRKVKEEDIEGDTKTTGRTSRSETLTTRLPRLLIKETSPKRRLWSVYTLALHVANAQLERPAQHSEHTEHSRYLTQPLTSCLALSHPILYMLSTNFIWRTIAAAISSGSHSVNVVGRSYAGPSPYSCSSGS